jgi:NADH-quinone oxidoreductase subunit A
MHDLAANAPSLWPLALYFALIVLAIGAIVVLSHFVGERHRGPQRDAPFESGVAPTGSARLRFDAQFYLVAIFFIIFDLESIFVFAWAIGFRRLGWRGFVEMAVFISLLLAGLIYIWKKGVLDWRAWAISRLREHEDRVGLPSQGGPDEV